MADNELGSWLLGAAKLADGTQTLASIANLVTGKDSYTGVVEYLANPEPAPEAKEEVKAGDTLSILEKVKDAITDPAKYEEIIKLIEKAKADAAKEATDAKVTPGAKMTPDAKDTGSDPGALPEVSIGGAVDALILNPADAKAADAKADPEKKTPAKKSDGTKEAGRDASLEEDWVVYSDDADEKAPAAKGAPAKTDAAKKTDEKKSGFDGLAQAFGGLGGGSGLGGMLALLVVAIAFMSRHNEQEQKHDEHAKEHDGQKHAEHKHGQDHKPDHKHGPDEKLKQALNEPDVKSINKELREEAALHPEAWKSGDWKLAEAAEKETLEDAVKSGNKDTMKDAVQKVAARTEFIALGKEEGLSGKDLEKFVKDNMDDVADAERYGGDYKAAAKGAKDERHAAEHLHKASGLDKERWKEFAKENLVGADVSYIKAIENSARDATSKGSPSEAKEVADKLHETQSDLANTLSNRPVTAGGAPIAGTSMGIMTINTDLKTGDRHTQHFHLVKGNDGTITAAQVGNDGTFHEASKEQMQDIKKATDTAKGGLIDFKAFTEEGDKSQKIKLEFSDVGKEITSFTPQAAAAKAGKDAAGKGM